SDEARPTIIYSLSLQRRSSDLERAGVLDDLGEGLAEPVPGLAVDGVVVLAAEPVVPDAGRVRHRRVHRGNGRTTRRIHGDILVEDRKSTRLNSSHVKISYAVFC